MNPDYYGDPDCPRQRCPGCGEMSFGHDGYTSRGCPNCGRREEGRPCCIKPAPDEPLRERLHTFFHVGPCRSTKDCPVRDFPGGAVQRMEALIAEWLRDQAAEPHADSGSDWFAWLANQIEKGP